MKTLQVLPQSKDMHIRLTVIHWQPGPDVPLHCMVPVSDTASSRKQDCCEILFKIEGHHKNPCEMFVSVNPPVRADGGGWRSSALPTRAGL